jgi:hypothetical protein
VTVLVAVPVLNRPKRAQPVAASLTESQQAVPLRLLFVCTKADTAELQAVRATGHDYITLKWHPGDYSRKINLAATMLQDNEEWLFTGADDLFFHPGWADHALACAARFKQQVVGTNDLGNPSVKRGHHSTHSLIHRDYIETGTIDTPGHIYHEGYSHNWCDVEMIETAKARRQFVFCGRARVEHLHPHWHKAEMDATYTKGLAEFKADRRLFNQRRRMWMKNRSYRRAML